MRNSLKTSIVIVRLALGGALAACAQTATSESTGAYVDDASITTKVKAAILDDAALKVFEIHVDTDKDVVELSGFVDSQMMIARAGHVAGGIAGVRSVRNDLAVR
jgi:hyperosmotically inducible periplasmic protein